MAGDEQIRTLMAAAGMLMEDDPAKVLFETLDPARMNELRQLATDLLRIADLIDVARPQRRRTRPLRCSLDA